MVKNKNLHKNTDFMYKYTIYTDGSYNQNTGYYGWAYVIYDETYNCIIHEASGKSNNSASSMWQVAGELSAVMRAIKYCKENNLSDIRICYDYRGVEEWVMKRWRTKNEYTKAYKAFMEKYKDVNYIFEHIKGHSGNFGNEYVDKMARKAAFS